MTRPTLPTVLFGALVFACLPSSATAQVPTFDLDTLRVTVGSRVDAASARAVEVITAERIRALPVRSVADLLDWALSVDLQRRSPAQADLSVRGGTFEQVLVLVDGVRVSDPQTGHFDLDLSVPVDRIERIEILRGGASAVHGADAFGGVVNIVTASGSADPSATVRLEGGSFGEVNGGVSLTAPVGEWAVSAGGSWDRSDGHREGTDYRIGLADVRATGPVAGGRATVSAGYALRDFGAADFYASFPSYEETRAKDLAARWIGPLSEGLELTLTASSRWHDDDFVLRRGDPAFYRNVHASVQTQFEATLGVDLGEGARLLVGGDWADESLESTNLGERDQTRTGVFAEVGVHAGRLTGQVGARLDDRSDVDEAFFSPSASFAWAASDRVRLRAGASRAFRAPTWTDRFYEDPANVGNPNLAVERGWTVEGGIDARAGRAVVSGTLFRRSTEDLIDWARSLSDPDAKWVTRNVESATFTGLELEVGGVRVGAIDLRAAATLLDLETEENAGFFSKSSLRPLTRTVAVGAATALPLGARVEALFEHRRRNDTEQGEFLDLRLMIPAAGADLYLDATNLLDDPMPDLTGFAVAGRAFRVGVRTVLGGGAR